MEFDLMPTAVDGEDAYKKLEQVEMRSMLLKPSGSGGSFRINLAESVSSFEHSYFYMTVNHSPYVRLVS